MSTIEKTRGSLDEDVLTVLDFEPALPCEWNASSKTKPRCDRAAEWKIVLSCCGGIGLVCGRHFDRMLEKINSLVRVRCEYCRKVHEPVSGIIASAERLSRT